MSAHDIILRPVITEKSTNLMDDKKYTFNVLLTATKTQVRDAVEEIFDVKVKKVNIMNVRGKDKRVGRYTGKTARTRKAIVTLTEDSNDIKIFKDDNENKEENK
ncbi:50S ribosomal protein L23 [Lactobacillus helsingborgensis]|uniref:Large ribosomal subunit protein uL23 n=1 Tax=Lactobacillus helsingborgensis TaxID=1218494 RepID=A0A0F4LXJ3_9LACO|nr:MULTISPECIES: 50S ribosomal protein L23 [Lactobacillus]MCT6903554.1 50S ribosomal protein L23 [Lactobacillus sp.]MEB3362725.1 50S ribosomal protein L23 [Lactobacillus sp. R2/2]AIS09659.1 LSU ribosomal protein L23p (L23Ae) [Lactobacillus sp. wkB8]AWN33877.1 50S ribosomal protein L23 [Lactobacillus helsingborgensis]KJY63462.1 50S ribosomal protein L23 [Lactobacillus helsingborgensis]